MNQVSNNPSNNGSVEYLSRAVPHMTSNANYNVIATTINNDTDNNIRIVATRHCPSHSQT